MPPLPTYFRTLIDREALPLHAATAAEYFETLDVPRLTLAPGLAGDPAEALSMGINAASGQFVLPLPCGGRLRF